MKKYIKDISIFVMGIITATSVGVAAYTISAKEIGYSPKDSSWKVSNVADAIESLKTSKGGSNIDYSTEEQNTGLKWINGKPIYQKTLAYKFTVLPNENVVDINVDDLEQVINYNAILTKVDGNMPVPNFISDDGTKYVKYAIFKNNGHWYISGYGNRDIINDYNGYVTIQYTKTTDTGTNSNS